MQDVALASRVWLAPFWPAASMCYNSVEISAGGVPLQLQKRTGLAATDVSKGLDQRRERRRTEVVKVLTPDVLSAVMVTWVVVVESGCSEVSRGYRSVGALKRTARDAGFGSTLRYCPLIADALSMVGGASRSLNVMRGVVRWMRKSRVVVWEWDGKRERPPKQR